MPCNHLKELANAEESLLRKEISKNRDYLSQKRHSNVELAEAERDFVDHDLKDWAIGFKDCYCNYVCMKENCDSKEE